MTDTMISDSEPPAVADDTVGGGGGGRAGGGGLSAALTATGSTPPTPPKTPEPNNSQKPDYKPGSNQAGLKQRCAEACAAVEAFQALQVTDVNERTLNLAKAALQHVKTNQQELEQLINDEETRQNRQERVKNAPVVELRQSFAKVVAVHQAARYAPPTGPEGKRISIIPEVAPKSLDTRKMKQVTVRISKEEEYQAARGLTQVELIK
ncbi:MAG: hypothetical protein Q9228_006638, partial [Teloschistes exilis]